LTIFYFITLLKNKIIFLDEPALHLHPFKIRYLVKFLNESENQIIIATHSPQFIDVSLFSTGKCLIFVKKDVNLESKIFQYKQNLENSGKFDVSKSDNNIPSHIFNEEIFFSKFVIMVEGVSDSSVFNAISDFFGRILNDKEILVLDAGGEGNVQWFYRIFKAYNIDYLAMVDSDYKRDKDDDTFTILSGDLEDELGKLGWKQSQKGSPDRVYPFIFKLMQTDKGQKQIKDSVFGKLLSRAVTAIGGKDPFTPG